MAPHSAQSRVRELLGDRRAFFSLPQPFYNDPAIFELDLAAVFHKRWILAGVECEIPNAGDYFTFSIGSTPIVVVRDQSGAINAFYNTCRHRGSKICLAEKGAVRKLVCPYHQWTYDLSGQLVATGRMHEGFDRDEYGLNMTCGASNVSFGMPGRHALNAAFLPMAMMSGLTSAIMDTRTPTIVDAVKAADLIMNHDDWGSAWIARSRAAKAAAEAAAAAG